MQVQITKILNTESGTVPLDIQLDIEAGSTVGIYGPSGSGKTMLLRCIAGLEKPDQGRIEFEDQVWFCSKQATNMPTYQRNVGLLFQDFPLFPHMNVEDNLGIGSTSKILSELLLAESGLTELRRAYPSKLSGGQRQRLALVQALASQPKLLLLDEPFSALDWQKRSHIQNLIRRCQAEHNMTILLVSHLMEDLIRMTSRILEIKNGRVTGDLSIDDFLRMKAEEQTVHQSEIIKIQTGEAYQVNGNHVRRI